MAYSLSNIYAKIVAIEQLLLKKLSLVVAWYILFETQSMC